MWKKDKKEKKHYCEIINCFGETRLFVNVVNMIDMKMGFMNEFVMQLLVVEIKVKRLSREERRSNIKR